jgi:hypothetical protein
MKDYENNGSDGKRIRESLEKDWFPPAQTCNYQGPTIGDHSARKWTVKKMMKLNLDRNETLISVITICLLKRRVLGFSKNVCCGPLKWAGILFSGGWGGGARRLLGLVGLLPIPFYGPTG